VCFWGGETPQKHTPSYHYLGRLSCYFSEKKIKFIEANNPKKKHRTLDVRRFSTVFDLFRDQGEI